MDHLASELELLLVLVRITGTLGASSLGNIPEMK